MPRSPPTPWRNAGQAIPSGSATAPSKAWPRPETANNAAATSSFIPLLTLGIPANATMAVIFGALLIQGITPGPQLVTEHPELFWGVVNSMYIGNILLLIMSIPLVGLFVRILRVRPSILAPVTVLITLLGAYTVNNSVFDIARGLLRRHRLPDEESRIRPRPAGAGLRAGIAAGESFPPVHAHLRRGPDRLHYPPISGTLLAAIVLLAVVVPIITTIRRRTRKHGIIAEVIDEVEHAEPDAVARSAHDYEDPYTPTNVSGRQIMTVIVGVRRPPRRTWPWTRCGRGRIPQRAARCCQHLPRRRVGPQAHP